MPFRRIARSEPLSAYAVLDSMRRAVTGALESSWPQPSDTSQPGVSGNDDAPGRVLANDLAIVPCKPDGACFFWALRVCLYEKYNHLEPRPEFLDWDVEKLRSEILNHIKEHPDWFAPGTPIECWGGSPETVIDNWLEGVGQPGPNPLRPSNPFNYADNTFIEGAASFFQLRIVVIASYGDSRLKNDNNETLYYKKQREEDIAVPVTWFRQGKKMLRYQQIFWPIGPRLPTPLDPTPSEPNADRVKNPKDEISQWILTEQAKEELLLPKNTIYMAHSYGIVRPTLDEDVSSATWFKPNYSVTHYDAVTSPVWYHDFRQELASGRARPFMSNGTSVHGSGITAVSKFFVAHKEEAFAQTTLNAMSTMFNNKADGYSDLFYPRWMHANFDDLRKQIQDPQNLKSFPRFEDANARPHRTFTSLQYTREQVGLPSLTDPSEADSSKTVGRNGGAGSSGPNKRSLSGIAEFQESKSKLGKRLRQSMRDLGLEGDDDELRLQAKQIIAAVMFSENQEDAKEEFFRGDFSDDALAEMIENIKIGT